MSKFNVGDRVRIKNTNSDLDGIVVTVLNNWAFDSHGDLSFLIVGFDDSYKGVKAIQIIMHCVEHV